MWYRVRDLRQFLPKFYHTRLYRFLLILLSHPHHPLRGVPIKLQALYLPALSQLLQPSQRQPFHQHLDTQSRLDHPQLSQLYIISRSNLSSRTDVHQPNRLWNILVSRVKKHQSHRNLQNLTKIRIKTKIMIKIKIKMIVMMIVFWDHIKLN